MRAVRLAVLAALMPLAGSPALAADAAKGLELATANCARCHDIAKGGAFKQSPPSFQAIAIYRTGMDIWGRIISPSPHSGMPNVAWTLTSEEVQDLLAYIVSLDTPLSLPQ
jgi:mono/diheme cytochrome c family protein